MFYVHAVEHDIEALLLSFLYCFLLSLSSSFPTITLTHNRLASVLQWHNSGRGEVRNMNRNKGDDKGKRRDVQVTVGSRDEVEVGIAGGGKREESSSDKGCMEQDR